ncbi:ISL3 family transposase [Streptococcus catagoni]|uniref:ISL3 family transposase n=1 Tax=Streptococcus catagoni TaxID=2654874 RepID=UPI00140BABDA|nr:ISL3 family transposase [Streptococcus catagoni]
MEHINHNKFLLQIKDQNISITDIKDKKTHFDILAKLDYKAPNCPCCGGQMTKYDFQKPCKIPYLDTGGYKTRLLLKKRRFRCKDCSKLMVSESSFVKKNHQIPYVIRHKISERLMDKESLTKITSELSISTSTVIRQLKSFVFKTHLNTLPTIMSWDEFAFKKGKMSFVAQDYEIKKIIAILNGRTQTIIRNHFLRHTRRIRETVKWITMDMFSPYYDLVRRLFPNAQIVLDRFHIIQHLNHAMNRTRIKIMNTFNRSSIEYRTIKQFWKLIQQDSRKLKEKLFYRPTFREHLTNREILTRMLGYSNELKYYYELYQLLLYHFQEKNSTHFFAIIEDHIKQVNPIFTMVFKTFKKDKDKIINALEQPYSNAKLEATNNIIKVIKRNAFGFRKFKNFKTRLLIALNIQKERTKVVLSRC